MDRKEAEDYIYSSYVAAEPLLDYDAPDSEKRSPDILRDLLISLSDAPCTVVTGSKGKGSVCCMLSALLSRRMAVGMMTSPHISSFNERIRVDGIPIDDHDLIACTEAVRPCIDGIEVPPGRYISPIGIQAAVALTHFRGRTGFNVLECGKGAAYDDVPRIPHRYAVVNTVFLEHTRELGPALTDIAEDKSHVITEGTECLFTAEQRPEVMEIISRRAERFGTRVMSYGRDFSASGIRLSPEGTSFTAEIGDRRIEGLRIPLLGEHMARNAVLAIAHAISIVPDLTNDEIREALAEVRWPGRTEMVSQSPLTIVDACINRESCQETVRIVRELISNRPTVIIGIPDDKDFLGVAETASGIAGRIILTRSSDPHYRFTDAQQTVLEEHGIDAESTSSLEEALALADVISPILILGTTSLVSDAESVFTARQT